MSHSPFPDMVAISNSFRLDFCAVTCSCIAIRGYCPTPLYKVGIFGHLKLNPVTSLWQSQYETLTKDRNVILKA